MRLVFGADKVEYEFQIYCIIVKEYHETSMKNLPKMRMNLTKNGLRTHCNSTKFAILDSQISQVIKGNK